jgi:hypothetical protein
MTQRIGLVTLLVEDYAAAEEPRQERYGVVAVFTDLYGNRWDLGPDPAKQVIT